MGARFTTSAGVVEITSIAPADEKQLTEHDAAAAGFDSAAALLKWCSGKGRGDLYRIGIVLAGPDSRVALRSADLLHPEDVAALNTRLDRMDRAAEQPGRAAPCGRSSGYLVSYRPSLLLRPARAGRVQDSGAPPQSARAH